MTHWSSWLAYASAIAISLLSSSPASAGEDVCKCTLTQGYWKTHSEYGPAPYDASWEYLPDGADTLFFNSGLTYYEMFWEAPAGDFYFALAHQYAAAELNLLYGSMAPPAVDAALNGARMLFEAQGAGDTTLTPLERRKAARWTATIDDYNNGITGPGHCDDLEELE